MPLLHKIMIAMYHRLLFGLRSEIFKGQRLRSIKLLWGVEYYDESEHHGHV